MSDEELDRNWVPNGRRPQSTMARSFSAELMDIFRIENSVSDLDNQVDQRKQKVGQSSDELAQLEKRIKEMEERLRKSQQGHSRPSIASVTGEPITSSDAAGQDAANSLETTHLNAKDEDAKARSRPGTARATQQAPSSGNMPPTPGGSEDGDRE